MAVKLYIIIFIIYNKIYKTKHNSQIKLCTHYIILLRARQKKLGGGLDYKYVFTNTF